MAVCKTDLYLRAAIKLETGITRLIKEILEVLETKSVKAFEIAKGQLPTDSMKNERLRQALEYYKKNWNDVLHPGVIAIACEAVCGNENDSVLMQVPMLFLTAAIDIHDDILDGSRAKNGKRTILGKFGEEIALLVGDGMLLKGMVALYTSGKKIVAERMDHIVATIDNAFVEAGEAHTAEMKFRGKLNLNPKEYFCMLEKKASVLEAHTRIGALVGNGKKNQIESLTQYGRILGTLIILRDEFIDLFEPQELSDRMKNGCLPLPMIYAFKNPEVRKGVMKILSKPKISRNDAETIVDFVFQDQKVKCLRNEMEDLSKKASKLTAGLCQQQNLHLLVTALLENLARV